MQYHTAYRAFQPHAEFEQAFPQGAHLRPRTRGAGRPQAQLLEQHVGGRAQQHPQLIGPEARATGAIDGQAVVQFFDAQFDVRTLAVHSLIDPLRNPAQVRDHEARVVLGIAMTQANRLRLDDHPTFAAPAAGRVRALAVEVLVMPAAPGQAPRLFHQRLSQTLEYRIARTQQIREQVLEYIEVDYNRTRRHSANGYISP